MKRLWLSMLPGLLVLAMMSNPATASGDAAAGANTYKKRCLSCHSLEPGKHKMGPSLAGIFGTKAGATDFSKYKGLKGFDAVWDEESLDKFLANPKKFVGAKTMVYKLKKEADRANVISYLKSLQ